MSLPPEMEPQGLSTTTRAPAPPSYRLLYRRLGRHYRGPGAPSATDAWVTPAGQRRSASVSDCCPQAERSISRRLRTAVDPERTSSKLKSRCEVVLQIDRFSRSNGLVGSRKVSIVRLPPTYGMKRARSTEFPVEQKPGSERGASIHGGYEVDRLVDGDRIEVDERGITGVLHAQGKYDVHAGTGVVVAPARRNLLVRPDGAGMGPFRGRSPKPTGPAHCARGNGP